MRMRGLGWLVAAALAGQGTAGADPIVVVGAPVRTGPLVLQATARLSEHERPEWVQADITVAVTNRSRKPQWVWCRLVLLAHDDWKRADGWPGRQWGYGLGGSRSLPSACAGYNQARLDGGASFDLHVVLPMRVRRDFRTDRTWGVIALEDFDRNPELLAFILARNPEGRLVRLVQPFSVPPRVRSP